MKQIQRTTLAQILGENNEHLTLMWNEAVAEYGDLMDNIDHITKYGGFVLKRLIKLFKPYRKMLSLYDEDTGRDLLLEEIIEFLPALLCESFTQSLIANKDLTDFSKIGTMTATGKNKVNYSGFSVVNQQGQYSGTEFENSSSGSTARLQYIAFIQEYTSRRCAEFISRVKSKILQLIY